MSFIINNVTVRNFRTHEEAELTPQRHGVTVIKGDNGSGKSSLVDSIAWGIFGIKPAGVGKNVDLKRRDAKEDDASYVRVTLTVADGDTYTIERRIMGKKGSVECDVFRHVSQTPESVPTSPAESTGDENDATTPEEAHEALEHVSGPSVTHSDEFIRSIAGISEKGFLASMFVQQKQVDELLTASPKERAVVIEKMTGITALTNAVTSIRAQARDAKKAVTTLADTIEDVDTDTISAAISDSEKQEKTARAKVKKLQKEKDSTEAESSRLRDELQGVVDLKAGLESLVKEKSLANSRLQEIGYGINNADGKGREKTRLLEKLKKQLGNHDATEVLNSYKSAEDNLSRLRSRIDRLKTDEEVARHDAQRARETISSACEKITQDESGCVPKNFASVLQNYVDNDFSPVDGEGDLIVKIEKVEEKLKDTSTNKRMRAAEVNDDISELKHTVSNNAKIIKALSSHDGHCPTCQQTPPNVEELLADLATSTDKAKKQGKQLVATRNQLLESAKAIEEISALVAIVVKTIPELAEMDTAINSASVEKAEVTKEMQAHAEKVEQLREAYGASVQIPGIISTIEELKKEKKSYQENERAQKEVINNLDVKYEKLSNRLREATKGTTDFVEEVGSQVHELSARAESINKEIAEVVRIADKAEVEKDFYARELETAKATLAHFDKAKNSADMLATSLKVVASFREKRIEEVVPEIAYTASDLLSSFTDGKFISLHLDKSYKASVELVGGDTRNVGLLSGGELSAVALALRLAIALIAHSGNDVNTMILDEVLVSQDEERVENIVSTIKEKLDGQVILIGHNGDIISSIADKIVEL